MLTQRGSLCRALTLRGSGSRGRGPGEILDKERSEQRERERFVSESLVRIFSAEPCSVRFGLDLEDLLGNVVPEQLVASAVRVQPSRRQDSFCCTPLSL